MSKNAKIRKNSIHLIAYTLQKMLINIIYCEYSNGNYTGEMKSFRRHGHGEYIWNSGKTYKGKWKNGKKVKNSNA